MSARNSSSRALRSKTVFLVGPMGVGKSTVGALLAERLGRPFIDTDREVERLEARSIAEIFARDGEARFRTLEAEAIDSAAQAVAVVALGGGAIAQPGAAQKLLELGIVVYLQAGTDVLLERIGEATTRPLLAGLDAAAQRLRLEALLAERAADYEKATLHVDASGHAPDVADEIMEALEKVWGPHPAAGEGQVA